MPANSKAIKLDVNGKPAPQYFNLTTDDYEYLLGEQGAARAILWGPDGQALSVVSRKLEVRASEIEDLLAAIRDTDGIRRIAEAVDIADRAARLLGKVGADDGALATLGALADAAKTDPAQAASVIALLKGLLQTLRNDGAKVQLSGSFATIRDMIGATKTATSVASEVFAGASRKPGRRGLWIKNEHPHIRIRVDGPGITAKTGVAVEPFASVVFTFDPAVDVPIYVLPLV